MDDMIWALCWTVIGIAFITFMSLGVSSCNETQRQEYKLRPAVLEGCKQACGGGVHEVVFLGGESRNAGCECK